MSKVGLMVLSNQSGLGNQTRRLTQMIKPYRILAIDSSGFSKNKKQNWHWYDGFTGYKVSGFPNNHEINVFLKDLTHVLVVENPFNFHLLDQGQKYGIKVYIQSNYEFCDHHNKALTLPHKFLMPSYWKIDDMKKRYGADRVQYLPPPINPVEFNQARNINMSRGRDAKPRFLHIVGTLAVHDRNGTIDLLRSVHYCNEDFELVVKSQHDLPSEYMVKDRRITYSINDEPDLNKLYSDFDALILPRRYGGLSLTTCEALMCGLPVIMTDISPNNQLLPKKWLVGADLISQFMTRTMIDVYGVKRSAMSQKIDWLCKQDLSVMKAEAFELGHHHFSETMLKPQYDLLWQ